MFHQMMRATVLLLTACGSGAGEETTPTETTGPDTDTTPTDTATDSDTDTTTDTDSDTTTTTPGGAQWIPLATDAIPFGQDTYDLTITDSGEVYVVYGREADQELWAMHSADGGVTWGAATQVTQGETWSHSLRDKPYILSNDQDVHVIFQEVVQSSFPSILMPTWYSASAGANLSFTGPTSPPIDPANNWNHFPQLGFRSDGELWLTWISFGLDFNKQGYFARESTGFTPELLPSSQTPCDCCQAHLMTTPDGDLMYAWRSEYQNLANQIMRDPVVFIARDGDSAFTEEVKMSASGWQIDGCPQQGVRMAANASTVYATWADTTAGPYQVWMAESQDGGRTWTQEIAVAPTLAAHNSPNMAVNDAGDVWIVVDQGGPTYLLHRPSGAVDFAPPPHLVSPDGSETLDPIVASRAGHTLLITQDAASHTLWLYKP